MTYYIETVLGPVAAEKLAVTLSHEHLFVNTVVANYTEPEDPREVHFAFKPVAEALAWVQANWAENIDNLVLSDEGTAIAETARFAAAGGNCIVDVTPVGIGRDPEALVRVSTATDLHIVMGAGFYVDVTHPAWIRQSTSSEIADHLIQEFTDGVAGTSIKPGLIGEIGCSWPITPSEVTVLQAAGIAQRELGCALSVHPGRNPQAPAEVLRILEGTGCGIERVIMCHVDRTPQSYREMEPLARSGCFVEFDLFGVETPGKYYSRLGLSVPTDTDRLSMIRTLIDHGHLHQILISQDICFKHRLSRHGGGGYAHIMKSVVPRMSSTSLFSTSEIRALLVDNPARALGIRQA